MDTDKFMKQEYRPREGTVFVTALSDYFEEGKEPVYKVRGLTATELAQAEETAEKNKNVMALVEAMAGGTGKDKVDAVKKALGFDSEEVPNELAKKLEYVTLGSVDPVITLDVAVKMAECHPIEFMSISREILVLTGQGHVPGKQKPSGEEKTSEPV